MKNIGEVFSDYKTESNIKLAQIEGMNLLKKVNVLEINIISTEYIEIKELWFFEQFLRERFMFSNIDIKIKGGPLLWQKKMKFGRIILTV